MKISEYAVKNYQLTLILLVMAVVIGVSTLLTMPRTEDPETHAPSFTVIALYPGTSPKDMEQLVVKPLEDHMYELDDIKKITTDIKSGLAVLNIEYKYSANPDTKYQEIVREVNNIRPSLPSDLYSLEVKKQIPSDVNVLQIALISENAPRDVFRTYAEQLRDSLQNLVQLKNVKIVGLPDRIVRVDIRLDKMAAMHISLAQVLGSLQGEMANIPGGSIEAGTKSFDIKTTGNFESTHQVQNTLISSPSGKNIRLSDIADVFDDYRESNHITRLNGHRCVFINAAQKEGNNISETQKNYLGVINRFKKSLPQNLDLVVHFDQANNVNHRLGGLGKDFLIAILLVSITLLPLGIRSAGIVMISIPLSLSLGLVFLNAFGFTLNQLSIVGLVVALGLLVDDSIVVIENIERWMLEGYSRADATFKASKQIGGAVLGCTITLIIAFIPLMFLPEASGDFIRSLPTAVILSVLASLLVSLTIIPFFASRVLKESQGHSEGNIFMRALKRLISGSYSRLLDSALNKPVITLLVAGLIFIGSLFLFPVVGFSLFPASEKPQFLIDIKPSLQSNLSMSDSLCHRVEKVLSNTKDVQYFASNIGEGNPRIYYNEIPNETRTDYAQIFVQLKESTSPSEKQKIIDSLRFLFANEPSASINVRNFEQGPPEVAPVEVRLFGNNLDSLRKYSLEIEKDLKALPGTLYVNNPIHNLKSDIRVSLDRDKARSLGVNNQDFDKIIRLSVAGIDMGTFPDPGGSKDNDHVLVTSPKLERGTLKNFESLYIPSANGGNIPLAQLAELKLESAPVSINHINKNRYVSITSLVQKGFLTDRVIQQVILKMNTLKLPKGYEYKMGGEVESRNNSFGGFGTVILVTIFLFIAALVVEFGTFKSTLIVLSVLPLGIVGAVIALFLSGNSLSFVAVIGIIALAGIEVKNSILLVDFTNQLRREGMSIAEAVRKAGEIRFLPIVLTSLTAIGGLIPIALSDNPLISPLAIVIIGGLISSTLLSRVVTPVVYELLPPHVDLEVKPVVA